MKKLRICAPNRTGLHDVTIYNKVDRVEHVPYQGGVIENMIATTFDVFDKDEVYTRTVTIIHPINSLIFITEQHFKIRHMQYAKGKENVTIEDVKLLDEDKNFGCGTKE